MTKYPIVFVHGIAIKDIFFIKSFGFIDKNLKNEGYKIYKAKIDSFGTIENNAVELKKEIEKVLQKENVTKVNIIAHSKGGLDAKYMIQKLDMEDKVASLTTLCTPHKGSPIAENILRLPKWILKFIAFWINLFYRIFGDKKPDALKVCKQLSLSKDIEEETFEISSKIYCQSYSSKMTKARDDFVMGIPYLFSHYFKKGEDTDGLVPVESAMFGEYKGMAFKEGVSHSEIMGYSLSKKKRQRIYKFYSEICNNLKNKGY